MAHMLTAGTWKGLSALLTECDRRFIDLVREEDELTYDTFADSTVVHCRTVDGYHASVLGKLKLHTRSGLVVFALRLKVVG